MSKACYGTSSSNADGISIWPQAHGWNKALTAHANTSLRIVVFECETDWSVVLLIQANSQLCHFIPCLIYDFTAWNLKDRTDWRLCDRNSNLSFDMTTSLDFAPQARAPPFDSYECMYRTGTALVSEFRKD